MSHAAGPNALHYRSAMIASIEHDLGRPMPLGTTPVPAEDRAGSGIATCYPFDDRSAIWCDPHIVDQLDPFVGAMPISARDFVDRAVGLGAAERGVGLNRVLDGPVLDPGVDLGALEIRTLDRENASDVTLIAEFRAAVSDDDAEEADLDISELDPHLVGAVEPSGDVRGERLLALASARLGDSVPFDDIGVLTHPGDRRRGLGVACVHRLIETRHASGVPAMYRCNEDNAGSDRIARRLGFSLVQMVGSVQFGTWAELATPY